MLTRSRARSATPSPRSRAPAKRKPRRQRVVRQVSLAPPPPSSSSPPVVGVASPEEVQPVAKRARAENLGMTDDFLVCPYASCQEALIDPACFYDHVFEEHASEAVSNHLLVCPICVAFFAVDPGTVQPASLLLHLRATHRDMEGASASIYGNVEPFAPPSPEHYSGPMEIGNDFTSFRLTAAMQVECLVCLDEFETGQEVIRMECFCLFHKDCVSSWWHKKNGCVSCPMHMHYDDE